jgi:hypothetical protein
MLFIDRTKGEVTIVPNDGLKLQSGKILAKKDVAKVVSVHETTGKNPMGSAFVQARVMDKTSA